MPSNNLHNHIELQRMAGMAIASASTLNKLRVNLMMTIVKSMEKATPEDKQEIDYMIEHWPNAEFKPFRSKDIAQAKQ